MSFGMPRYVALVSSSTLAIIMAVIAEGRSEAKMRIGDLIGIGDNTIKYDSN